MGQIDTAFEFLETIEKNITNPEIDEKLKKLQNKYLAEEIYLLHQKDIGSLKQGTISLFYSIAQKEYGKSKTDITKALGGINTNKEENSAKYAKLKKLLIKNLRLNNKQRFMYQYDKNDFSDIKLPLNIDELCRYEDIVFLPKKGDLYVFGDIHGDAETLKFITDEPYDRLKKGENLYLVFLGDYVNNGLNSIDSLIYVLNLKKYYSSNVVLLSGNHEFRETYGTVLKEYFDTHWNNAPQTTLPKNPPNHYGHIRLELINNFGVEKGEEIYKLFELWGRSLPYIAFSDKGIMMSHSIGLPKPNPDNISFKALAGAKKNLIDIALFKALGYEAWRKSDLTLHASMVNNGAITHNLLRDFIKELKGVRVFVVGHRHYRSGDIHKIDFKNDIINYSDVIKNNEKTGRFVTICSSHEESLEAGHYIAYEFQCTREKESEEGRKNNAKACYALFTEPTVSCINKDHVKEIILKGNYER